MNRRMLAILCVCPVLAISCQEGYKITEPVFDVEPESHTVKVGEPVVFNINCRADIVSFYSGEFGNDYAYKDKERLTPATANISFDLKQTVSGDAQLLNPAIVPISFSTDFNGVYDVENMEAATWSDITDRFSFPAEDYHIPTKNGSVTTSNKAVDINDCFEKGLPIYLRFRYFLKKYDSTAKVGRTTVQIMNFSIDGHTDFADVQMYPMTGIGWNFVKMSSWTGASDKSSLPGAQASLTMNCEWNPSQDREIYAIAGPIEKAADVNSGIETSVPLKVLSDPDLTTYSYSFDKPGSYDVVFVAKNTNINGKREVVRHVSILVVEDGGSIVPPEEGSWND